LPIALRVRDVGDGLDSSCPLKVLISRHHKNPHEDELAGILSKSFPFIDYVQAGSSLKFCHVAEGNADFYPRLAPTCEWDTGAAQAIVEAAGGYVVDTRFTRLS
jgi:3'(2'), 5'-bisphosphate nucleotidase